ncbi:MAG: Zn-dependent hydrolase [Deltaproteobacteria bacterium RBG_13_43_22]|nr:MAG: Zn-dependent hydrolase [Deltaproteobacteria bacterium RBG_13_43_22]
MKIADNLHAFIWRNPQTNNCNTYLIKGSKTILIDPGHVHLFDYVRSGLQDLNLTPEQIDLIIITHAHPDHLEAAALFRKPTLLTMSLAEFVFAKQWLNRYGLDAGKGIEPDFFLQDGKLIIGDLSFQVIITPGHSPGSICLYWPEYKALFTGDLIFSQGIGRTDLPGGNGGLLKESILQIAVLDIEYLLSGHGEVIKGKKAVEANFRMIESTWFDYL